MVCHRYPYILLYQWFIPPIIEYMGSLFSLPTYETPSRSPGSRSFATPMGASDDSEIP